MTDDEVDELLKVVDTSSGEINYTGLSSLLFYYLSRAAANRRYCVDLVRTILAN